MRHLIFMCLLALPFAATAQWHKGDNLIISDLLLEVSKDNPPGGGNNTTSFTIGLLPGMEHFFWDRVGFFWETGYNYTAAFDQGDDDGKDAQIHADFNTLGFAYYWPLGKEKRVALRLALLGFSSSSRVTTYAAGTDQLADQNFFRAGLRLSPGFAVAINDSWRLDFDLQGAQWQTLWETEGRGRDANFTRLGRELGFSVSSLQMGVAWKVPYKERKPRNKGTEG